MHCIRLYNKIDPYLPSNKEKIGSIRPRSVNDQLTTLPFGGIQKYYDGSVALYIDYIFLSAICLSFSNPKVAFLFDQIN